MVLPRVQKINEREKPSRHPIRLGFGSAASKRRKFLGRLRKHREGFSQPACLVVAKEVRTKSVAVARRNELLTAAGPNSGLGGEELLLALRGLLRSGLLLRRLLGGLLSCHVNGSSV
jgi:hypothetical protein